VIFYAFNTEKKGRDKYSTRIRVNPVGMFPIVDPHTEASSTYCILYKKGRKGRHNLVAGVSENPVRFLPPPIILKANFTYSEQRRQKNA
jgi:hypothetical protein